MTTSFDPASSPPPPPPDRFVVPEAAVRARIAASTPIRFDSCTHEPYLQLEAPLERFRLTPSRYSDAEDLSRVLSTLSVARNLLGPPFPYPAARAGNWLRMLRGTATSTFVALAEGTYQGLPGHPFCFLREVADDGSGDAYVGEISMGIDEDASRVAPVQPGWEAWRNESVWTIGACLSQDYHGRGLAKSAVRTLMQFAIAHAGATEVHAECFTRNQASVRLWLGAGFVKNEAMSGKIISVVAAKGGGEEEEVCLVWALE